jgi:hypothetical protein
LLHGGPLDGPYPTDWAVLGEHWGQPESVHRTLGDRPQNVGQMVPGGAVTLNHSVVIGNTAHAGGGIFNMGGTVALSESMVIGNHPDNCEPLGTIAGCIG